MLVNLAALHLAFGRWYKTAYTRAGAYRPFCTMPPSIDDLARIFANDRKYNRIDLDGYGADAWNGAESPHGLRLRIDAGDAIDRFQYFPNYIELNFSSRQQSNADLTNFDIMQRSLLCFIKAWNPHFAKIDPFGYIDRWVRDEPWDDDDRKVRRPPDDGYAPRVTSGWMLYLCPDYARRITPPPGIETEPVGDGGLLMIATREVFTPGNPAHDAAADAIQESLLPLQNLPR